MQAQHSTQLSLPFQKGCSSKHLAVCVWVSPTMKQQQQQQQQRENECFPKTTSPSVQLSLIKEKRKRNKEKERQRNQSTASNDDGVENGSDRIVWLFFYLLYSFKPPFPLSSLSPCYQRNGLIDIDRPKYVPIKIATASAAVATELEQHISFKRRRNTMVG